MNITREEAGVLLTLIAEKIDRDAYKESEGFNTALNSLSSKAKLVVQKGQ